MLLIFAAAGPLLIVLVYSFLLPGKYGNVEWGVFAERLAQRPRRFLFANSNYASYLILSIE